MAAIDDWNKYAQSAQENLERVRGDVRQKINDPNTSTADRDKAIIDLETQEHYVAWVQEQNAQIQQTGVVPSTMSIDSWSAGSGIWQDGQGKYRPARFINEPVAGNQQRIGTTYTQNVADLDGNVISFRAQVTNTPSSSAVNFFRIKKVEYNPQTGYLSTFSMLAWDNEWYNQWKWQFGTADSYKEQTVPSSWSSFSNYACISGCLTTVGVNPPVHTAFNDLCGVGDWDLVNPVSFNRLFSIVGEAEITGGDVDPENPWDFFNDNINPDIDPDNSIFPNGYDPVPDKPDPDKPDYPGDVENGGDNIEPNDTTGIGGSFGFLTQYALRGADIENIGRLLWAGFDPNDPGIDSYLQNFVYLVSTDTGSVNMADILEFFVSLKMYPFPLGNVHTLTAAGHNLYIGAGTVPLAMTNIIHTMDSYSGTLSAGSVSVPFWFGDFRDYQCEITLYLPYCGTVQLNPGDVMGGTLECMYEIDFCTGGCTAYCYCTTWDGLKFPVASVPGQIGADVPMSATNAGRVASRVIGDRITAVENMLSTVKYATTGIGAMMQGNFAGAVRSGISAFIDPAIADQKQLAGMGERGAISAPVLGSGGGFTAFKNPATAYVQVRSPFYPDVSEIYPDAVGDPAAAAVTIGDCSGFCQFVNVDVSGITTDAGDQQAIRAALANGVYI